MRSDDGVYKFLQRGKIRHCDVQFLLRPSDHIQIQLFHLKPAHRLFQVDAKEYILAISNPCFELFLLLHMKDSYLNHIKENKIEIERNQKISKSKRFIGNLFFEVTGMNSKKNKLIGHLASNVKIAINQETRFINQDLTKGFQELTSTTGLVIQQILDDDSKE